MDINTLWQRFPKLMQQLTVRAAADAARDVIRRKTTPTRWNPQPTEPRDDAQLLKDALGWEDQE